MFPIRRFTEIRMDELSGGAKSYMLGNARKPLSVSLVSKAKLDDRFLVFDLGLAPPPLDHPHHSCPASILLVLFAGLDLFKPDPLEHERKHCARASLKLDHTLRRCAVFSIFVRLRIVEEDEVWTVRVDVETAYGLVCAARGDDAARLRVALQDGEALV